MNCFFVELTVGGRNSMKEFLDELNGPFSLYGGENLLWDSPAAQQSGLYIWIIEYQNNYFIEYVGETGKSFFKRMKDRLFQKFLHYRNRKILYWSSVSKFQFLHY